MISPQQVERIEEKLDNYRAMAVVGFLFFLGGIPFAVFGSQDPPNAHLMLQLMSIEELAAILFMLWGLVKVRSLEAELRRHEPGGALARSAGTAH